MQLAINLARYSSLLLSVDGSGIRIAQHQLRTSKNDEMPAL